MERRNFLKTMSLATAGTAGAGVVRAAVKERQRDNDNPALTLAHITDVHIRPEEGVPERFKKCLELVKKHKVDFILNG